MKIRPDGGILFLVTKNYDSMKQFFADLGAAAPPPAGQLDGSGNLSATVAADRAFTAAVAELGLGGMTCDNNPHKK